MLSLQVKSQFNSWYITLECFCFRQPILPKQGETAAARLRALGRDFHPECFKCEVIEWQMLIFLPNHKI